MRPKDSVEKTIRVGTHSGRFHADDAFAIAAITLLGAKVAIVRTRDAEQLARCDIRVDVGGRYDQDARTFDHHQPEGAGARPDSVVPDAALVPYASFGLIWKWLGEEVCGGQREADMVDAALVQEIDANDNGMMHSGLAGAIAAMNPTWQEPFADRDDCFNEAVVFARQILRRAVEQAKAGVAARGTVLAALAQRQDPRLLVLEQTIPWQLTVHEEQAGVLLCVLPSSGGWSVRCVSAFCTFDSLHPLPAAWAGLKGAELREVTGVSDAEFCHRARFLAGALSKEGALRLAALALEGERR